MPFVRTVDPLAPAALRFAAGACGLVLLAAFVGAAVRLLPWVLDPTIARSMLAPFAKSLAVVAVEAALLTGWPVGWAIATQRLCDRGEARVLAALGEAPLRSAMRLAPQAAVLGLVLAAISASFGREAAAPGRVVNALLEEGRAVCAAATEPSTFAVPFVSATWLCTRQDEHQDEVPALPAPRARLVGRAPIGAIVFTARAARISDDLRRIDLDDARVSLPSSSGSGPQVQVHVGTLTLRGLPPWARASALAPPLRALVVTASALAAAFTAVVVILRITARQRRVGGVLAVALGAVGPLAALAVLRGVELRVPDVPPGALGSGWIAAFCLAPLAALMAVLASAALVLALRQARGAGTK